MARIAAAHGVAVDVLEKQADVAPAIARAAESGGVKILVVRTDRAANVAVHDEIHAAVHKALWRK